MSRALVQLACWTYLPDFLTRQVLTVTHQVSQRVFEIAPPAPRTPKYIQRYRYTYAFVVLCYLTYNFVDASSGLAKNFYELLGVSPGTDEGGIKAAFRAFARKNHPDRVGPEGEALFVDVRDAFEALKDPVVRFAYDRFGPDVLRWQGCTTMKDYLRRGLLNWMPGHVLNGVGLFLFSVVGRRNPVAAWRYLLFVGVFALELYLIVGPSVPSVVERMFPQRVGYQHIRLLNEAFLFMSIAVSRVGPVLFADMMEVDEGGVIRAVSARIGEMTKGIERELWDMLKSEVNAIDEDEFRMEMVLREMEDMVVENKLKNEAGPMESAWNRALQGHTGRARTMSL